MVQVGFYSYANHFYWQLHYIELTLLLSELRPGMENIDLELELVEKNEPREVTTYTGFKHQLAECSVKDSSMTMNLTVWNEKIELLDNLGQGDHVELKNCFITSFKGVLSVNVGRDSDLRKK